MAELAADGKALAILEELPPDYKLSKDSLPIARLTEEVRAGSELGKQTVLLLTNGTLDFLSKSGSELGKRYRCLICDSEVLCVKCGDGYTECHSQKMVLINPRPVPSSD